MNRRKLLIGGAVTAAALAGGYWWLGRNYDGNLFNQCAGPLPDELANSELLSEVWRGVDPTQWWDNHVHLVGLGHGDSGVWVNPDMQTWANPSKHIQYKFYFNAACMEGKDNVDEAYFELLEQLVDDFPEGAKFMLLAFDYHHNERGEALPELSTFFVPNEHAQRLALLRPQRFEWVASIHPYRNDAIDALNQAIDGGAKAVKWLPPAHGIDPASPKCDDFYRVLAQRKIPLIIHAGEEKAVHGADAQKLGNPLRLRRALDLGVTMVVSHCASLGKGTDLDASGDSKVDNFALFGRLMDEGYPNLFGDISAITQVNRDPLVIPTLLQRGDWHARLINGSDFPLPGVMPLSSARRISRMGFLDESLVEPLVAIRQHNPVLFDFALKRSLRFEGQQFATTVFETAGHFGG